MPRLRRSARGSTDHHFELSFIAIQVPTASPVVASGADRLFDTAPSRRAEATFRTMPAVDVSETDKAYKITAELPGLDEKNIEVKLANGVLSIKEAGEENRGERRLIQRFLMRIKSYAL